MISLAILGLGARGGGVYGDYIREHSGSVKVNAICDIDAVKLEKFAKLFDVPASMCFLSSDDFFNLGKVSDGVLICTDDKEHYKQAIMAVDKGYDIILEKPIAVSENECIQIRDYANSKGVNVLVSHVLRYTEYYNQIKKIVASGEIGSVVNINQTENIGYWHFAHSYVRGNWKKKQDSSPIVLAKCSHDLDILNWLINKKCVSVSSYGALSYFKKSNKPQGAAKRCLDCCLINSCEYSAEKAYISDHVAGNNGWLANYLCNDPTTENIYKALKEGPYGVCVFDSDNDVFDHQICNLLYEDGVTANLTLIAFTKDCFRKIHVVGTKGEIIANDKENILTVNLFGNKSYDVDIKAITSDFSGHGGGDNRMLEDFIKFLKDNSYVMKSTITQSIESHIMAFKCEESAVNGGERIRV